MKKRISLAEFAKIAGFSGKLVIMKKDGKRAFCYIGNQLLVLGERTDARKPMFVVEGKDGAMWLSNNEVPAENQVVAEIEL